MILTGPELREEVLRDRIVIDPFDPERLEPNSYGFRLAPQIICYEGDSIDSREEPPQRHLTIGEEGLLLQSGRFYLGSTVETMGSLHYAATLYARRSISTLGMWIQFSAPLGHVGAIIPWTLEIQVAAPLIVYPGMLVGKIAFWKPLGVKHHYDGKYSGSQTTVASRLSREIVPSELRA